MVEALAIDGSYIYAGRYSFSETTGQYVPEYWKSNSTDTEWTALTNEYGSSYKADVYSLSVDGNDLYAGGYIKDSDNVKHAGYWENDTWVECANSYGEYNAEANSIVVVTE